MTPSRSMRSSCLIPLIGLLVTITNLTANGQVFHVNFDTAPDGTAIPNGTVVNTVYAAWGVTFEAIVSDGSPRSDTNVYASSNCLTHGPISPPNVVTLFGIDTCSDISESGLGLIQATFATPVDSVCIGVKPVRPTDFGVLHAYDASGQEIATGFSTAGITENVCLNAPGIKRVSFSGSGNNFTWSDDLVFRIPPQGPVVSCPSATTAQCGVPVEVTANVSDPDGDALNVFWTINGQLVQTNSVAASESEAGTNVSLVAEFPLGTNLVGVLVTDSATNPASCSTTVTVIDTTPPVIVSADAHPSVLWPPNHQMVPVRVNAQVTDNCGPAEWKITDVKSDEPLKGQRGHDTGPDWVITGNHTVSLRAERSGTGTGRIYSIIVQAMDTSGNMSESRIISVTVPKSRGK